jgi:hypothetical protein
MVGTIANHQTARPLAGLFPSRAAVVKLITFGRRTHDHSPCRRAPIILRSYRFISVFSLDKDDDMDAESIARYFA